MDRTKKVLITLLVVGALATVGVGTYATFTAQTTNASNTFQTGTIVLSQKVNTGTTCYSTGAASGTFTNSNANGACDTVAFATLAKPGDSAAAQFTVKDEGNLGASAMTLQVSGCVTTDSPNASSVFHGNGDLCPVLGFFIQEYDSTFTTANGKCVLPANAGANCSASSVASFTTLGTAQNLYTNVAAGDTHYLKVTLVFPDGGAGADNAYQGRVATFNAVWKLNQ